MTEGTQEASFRIATGGTDGDVSRLVFVLDELTKNAGVSRLREWGRTALAAGPGERAVDVGSGTGEQAQAMALATGDATGVEPIAGLRAEAERRAVSAGSAARFVDSDAYALPFDESTVDVLWCERVFQHLQEPERAAAEFARVLRPGGRVVLLDSDWATVLMHPGDPEIVRSLQRFWFDRSPNPFAGRRLAGQLTAAGLEVVDQGSQALIQDGVSVHEMLRLTGTVAVTEGAVTEARWTAFLAELDQGVARGDFHFSVTMFGVLARKPLS